MKSIFDTINFLWFYHSFIFSISYCDKKYCFKLWNIWKITSCPSWVCTKFLSMYLNVRLRYHCIYLVESKFWLKRETIGRSWGLNWPSSGVIYRVRALGHVRFSTECIPNSRRTCTVRDPYWLLLVILSCLPNCCL